VFADVGRNLAAQPAAGRLIEPEMDAAKDARVVDVVGDQGRDRDGVPVQDDVSPAWVGLATSRATAATTVRMRVMD